MRLSRSNMERIAKSLSELRRRLERRQRKLRNEIFEKWLRRFFDRGATPCPSDSTKVIKSRPLICYHYTHKKIAPALCGCYLFWYVVLLLEGDADVTDVPRVGNVACGARGGLDIVPDLVVGYQFGVWPNDLHGVHVGVPQKITCDTARVQFRVGRFGEDSGALHIVGGDLVVVRACHAVPPIGLVGGVSALHL